MNQYDIFVNVRGSHLGDEDSSMELFTEGTLTCEDNGSYTIEYDESELSGMENTTTRLHVEGERVSMRRKGMLDTEFVFLKNHTFEAAYETPYGMMQMSVLPTQIESVLTNQNGSIDLEYVIRIGDQQAVNKLNINYKVRN